MNIRCAFCQTPYTLSRNEILFALQKMDSENQHHYDAHCPRCRRATQLPRQRIEMAFPNWRQAVEEAASAPAPVAETPKVEKPAAAPAGMEQIAPAKAEANKPAAKSAGKEKTAPVKATASKAKPAATKKTASKPAPVKSKTTKKK